MAAEKIGPARCPLCGGTASVGLSRKQLPVLTCNGCNIQLFTRSDRSDDLVRRLLIKTAQPKPEATPEAAPAPAPAAASGSPDELPDAEPADPVPAAPAPEPVTTRSPFGLLGL